MKFISTSKNIFYSIYFIPVNISLRSKSIFSNYLLFTILFYYYLNSNTINGKNTTKFKHSIISSYRAL